MRKKDLKVSIAKLLFDCQTEQSAQDISSAIKQEYQVVYSELRALSEKGMIEKIGKSYVISDAGIVEFGFKPIAIKCVEIKPDEPVIKKPTAIKRAIKMTEQIIVATPVTPPPVIKRDLNPANFQLWRSLEEAGDKIISMYATQKITDAANKANKLRELAALMNSDTACLLNAVAADLECYA